VFAGVLVFVCCGCFIWFWVVLSVWVVWVWLLVCGFWGLAVFAVSSVMRCAVVWVGAFISSVA
jgi:hypothetical protein